MFPFSSVVQDSLVDDLFKRTLAPPAAKLKAAPAAPEQNRQKLPLPAATNDTLNHDPSVNLKDNLEEIVKDKSSGKGKEKAARPDSKDKKAKRRARKLNTSSNAEPVDVEGANKTETAEIIEKTETAEIIKMTETMKSIRKSKKESIKKSKKESISTTETMKSIDKTETMESTCKKDAGDVKSDNEDAPLQVDAPRKTGEKVTSDSPERLSRTVFIGNVTTNVKDKKVLRAFKKLLLESAKDDTQMPEQEAEQCEGQAQDKPSKTSILESIRFRSVSFARNVPRNMRAIAFRNKELHEERDTLNAYAVFTSTAYASRVCEALNGHVFQDQHLRADMADGSSKPSPKKCVFVGNLPFTASEASVRAVFEPCGDIAYVRVIRDAATSLGKGFGYVCFDSSASVSLALQLDARAEVDGRPLRVSRCETGAKMGKAARGKVGAGGKKGKVGTAGKKGKVVAGAKEQTVTGAARRTQEKAEKQARAKDGEKVKKRWRETGKGHKDGSDTRAQKRAKTRAS